MEPLSKVALEKDEDEEAGVELVERVVSSELARLSAALLL